MDHLRMARARREQPMSNLEHVRLPHIDEQSEQALDRALELDGAL